MVLESTPVVVPLSTCNDPSAAAAPREPPAGRICPAGERAFTRARRGAAALRAAARKARIIEWLVPRGEGRGGPPRTIEIPLQFEWRESCAPRIWRLRRCWCRRAGSRIRTRSSSSRTSLFRARGGPRLRDRRNALARRRSSRRVWIACGRQPAGRDEAVPDRGHIAGRRDDGRGAAAPLNEGCSGAAVQRSISNIFGSRFQQPGARRSTLNAAAPAAGARPWRA
jgi:hypothetical protein